MRIDSLMHQFRRGLVTNTDSNAFVVADYRPRTTKPTPAIASGKTARVVLDWGPRDAPGKQLSPREENTLVVMPFGGNDNNDLILVKVCGWRAIAQAGDVAGDGLTQYVSTFICGLTATLSSALPGNAGRSVVATDLFADTLTATGTAVLYQGTADVDPAMALCDVSGFELVTIDLAVSTGGDGANCLWATQ